MDVCPKSAYGGICEIGEDRACKAGCGKRYPTLPEINDRLEHLEKYAPPFPLVSRGYVPLTDEEAKLLEVWRAAALEDRPHVVGSWPDQVPRSAYEKLLADLTSQEAKDRKVGATPLSKRAFAAEARVAHLEGVLEKIAATSCAPNDWHCAAARDALAKGPA